MSDLIKLSQLVEEEAERRRQLREQISFEQCSSIKRAGELFREKDTEEIAEAIGRSPDETKSLIRRYAVLVNSPTENVPAMAMLRGVKFYGKQTPFGELVEEDDSREKIQEEIREFVAVTLDENDVESVEIDTVEIPEDTIYPEVMTETARKVQQTVSSISPPLELYTGLTEFSARLSETLTNLQPVFESLSKTASQILPEITRAIEDGISNFDSPENYDPDNVKFDESTEAIAITSLDRFIGQIDREEIPEFGSYIKRLEFALEHHSDEQYLAAIFIFISIQDGLMDWLCQQEGVSPDNQSRFGDDIYRWETKRDTLARLYEGWYNVDTRKFVKNLDAFYQHRNAIMHGDPLAYFDRNIATISLLFLDVTLYTVIEYVD